MGYEAKTEAACKVLSSDILNGTLSPGKPLRLAALGAQYGVSATPLREALTRLEEQKLVVAEANRGWRVAPVSIAEFTDLLIARQSLEVSLLEDVIAHGGNDWETELVTAHYRLAQAVPPLGAADTLAYRQIWVALHDRFHTALLAGARSDWLKRFYTQLLTQLQRHHQAVLLWAQIDSRQMDVLREQVFCVLRHTELMVAVLDRDRAAATALMKAHNNVTLSIFLTAMKQAEHSLSEAKPKKESTA